jgi:hypothetical protein
MFGSGRGAKKATGADKSLSSAAEAEKALKQRLRRERINCVAAIRRHILSSGTTGK